FDPKTRGAHRIVEIVSRRNRSDLQKRRTNRVLRRALSQSFFAPWISRDDFVIVFRRYIMQYVSQVSSAIVQCDFLGSQCLTRRRPKFPSRWLSPVWFGGDNLAFKRGWIGALLFNLSLINYTDRVALSVAAQSVANDFHLSSVGM